jgi:tripartite-type tricarboxylate transporter receptor subunit TctC
MHSIARRRFIAGAFGSTLAVTWPRAFGYAYPERPVTLVVPYPAGGVVDVSARIVSEKLTERLGQSFIVENKAGANGNLGAHAAREAKADGYTLLVGSMFLVLNPMVDKTSKFALQDFEPIASIGSPPNILVVPTSSDARNARELVQLAKSSPGKLNAPHAGPGSSLHLGLQLFAREAGIEFASVGYKGQPPFMTNLVNGDLQFGFVTSALALPYIQAGKLRALAIASNQRLPQLPEVPTLTEAGYPNSVVLPWNGLFARSTTPRPVLELLAREVEQVLRDPAVRKRYETIAAEIPAKPQELKLAVESERQRWKRLVDQRWVELAG